MIKPTELNLGKNEIVEKNGYKLHVDKVMQSKWLASDGTWAEFIANYNDYDVDIDYPSDEPCVVADGDGEEINAPKFAIKPGGVIMIKSAKGQ